MGERVEVALLGPVEVRVGGTVVPLSSVPQRLVLARLVLARGRVVPVAELVDALWGDTPPANAVGNLHSYVSRLRRLVGSARLAREPAGYRLRLPDDRVDVIRVERLVADARSVASTDPARAAGMLGEALGLWRGEPLSNLADRLAFGPDVARLAEWRRQVREEWFELRLTAGHAADVLPELEEAVAGDPLRERVHLQLMRALHQAGRTAEALRVADGFRRRLVDDFGLDPGPALGELQRRLLADDPALRARPRRPPQPAPAVYPVPTDRFVGRGRELELVREALRAHRSVTVVGPGGVGKTRLVLELLRGHGDGAPTYVVGLAETPTTADVAVVVAGALGLRAAPEGGRTALADRLGREPALLVLDNCEHLLAPAADLVAELLGRCPAVRVLATSRQRLGVAGERVIRLGPLSEADQVELFCDRAALLRADFEVSERTRGLAADVCRLLDGLPLAVELAACREAVFGLPQLRDRLSAGLEVLEPARGGDRSTAVTATVEWSYRLLDPDAQALLDRLAVCRAGFPAGALDYFAPAGAGNGAALLAELVDASLVSCDLTADPPRYRLLETVRHVGLGHLTAAGVDDAHDAHARWMVAHAELIHARQRVRSAESTRLLRREVANLQEAMAWLAAAGRWDEAGRLGVLAALAFSDEPHLGLGEQLRRLAPDTLPPRTEADGLRAIAAGTAAWLAGDAVTGDRLLTAALDTLPAGHPLRWIGRLFHLVNTMFSGDTSGVEADTDALLRDPAVPDWVAATAVCCTALINLFVGDRPAAERWLGEHDDLLIRVDQTEGFIAYTRGELAAESDPEAALAWFEQAYRQCDAQEHTYNREVAAVGRAAVLIRLGRHAEAVSSCRSLVDSLRRLGMWPQLWMVLRLVAELLVALDDLEPAAVVLTAADADPLAPVVLEAERERHTRLWARITGGLDPGRVTAARREGRAGGRAGAATRALLALDRHG